MCRVTARLLFNYPQERKLFFRAKSGAGGASPPKVYDLVLYVNDLNNASTLDAILFADDTNLLISSRVVLAACKVGRPIYTCIYRVYIAMVSALTSSSV